MQSEHAHCTERDSWFGFGFVNLQLPLVVRVVTHEGFYFTHIFYLISQTYKARSNKANYTLTYRL